MPSVAKLCRFVGEATLPLKDLLVIIGSAENSSEHSLARAVVGFAKRVLQTEKFYKCSSFQVVPGCGLKAKVHYDSTEMRSVSLSSRIPEIVDMVKFNSTDFKFGKVNTENSIKVYDVLIGRTAASFTLEIGDSWFTACVCTFIMNVPHTPDNQITL